MEKSFFVKEYNHAATFWDRTKNFLCAKESQNNLLVSNLLVLAKNGGGRSSSVRYFVLERNGRIEVAALLSFDKKLLVSEGDFQTNSCDGIGKFWKLIGEKNISRLIGPKQTVQYLLGCALEVVNYQPTLDQRVLRLNQLSDFVPSQGIMRRARSSDLTIVIQWAKDFARECQLDENPNEVEEMIRYYVENRFLYVWDVGKPIAMAGIGGSTIKGARINMVYTHPDYRGRNFAGSLVYLLSKKVLQSPREYCVLFTDSRNPVSNHLYEKLGYYYVCDFVEYRSCLKI